MTDTVQDGAIDPKAALVVPTPDAHVAAFEQLGFGLFIHYGLYSQLRQGEWVWFHHNMDRDEYLKLVPSFDPSGFDADALCSMAKAAGCRYICMGTRHHEGFSLYDTRGLNDYHSQAVVGRDLVAEFSAACEKHGLKKFFYHTTLDWWHEDFDGDWDAYQQYLRDSVQILCEHYGTVDGFWFDGNWARKDRDWQEDALYGLIRERQPNAIIVNNSSIGSLGAEGHPLTDVVTFEQGVPKARDQRGQKRYRAAEMCETMNSHWGVGDLDLSMKSPADVVTSLAACRRFKANLLLNIGPNPDGSIPAYERAVFELVGRWAAICPEALTLANPTTLQTRGTDFVLQHGKRFYHFVHNVAIKGNRHLLRGEPGDGLQTIQGDLGSVRSISWADNNETLSFTQDGERLMYDATPFTYGSQLVIRIAVIDTE